MVDVNRILHIIDAYYEIDGTFQVNPHTLVVDVEGDISLARYVPEFGVQFGRVSGNFLCYNKTLKSLKGAPTHVGGSFECNNNQISSLEHAPVHVEKEFWCQGNNLINLDHAPAHVGGNFYCSNNLLVSLKGAPKIINRDFFCNDNQLTTLDHAPEKVLLDFDCENNPLINLTGLPIMIGTCTITWHAQLPLLRCLNSQLSVALTDAPVEVESIINRYVGSGKKGALACAAELIRAGYKENAKW